MPDLLADIKARASKLSEVERAELLDDQARVHPIPFPAIPILLNQQNYNERLAKNSEIYVENMSNQHII